MYIPIIIALVAILLALVASILYLSLRKKSAGKKPAVAAMAADPPAPPADPCSDDANCGKLYVRTVQCLDQYGNVSTDESKCSGDKPEAQETCKACPTPQWVSGQWVDDDDKKNYSNPPPCDTLEGHSFSRQVDCEMGGQKVDDSKCTGAKPKDQYFCAPPVQFQFRSGNWQEYWDGTNCGGACPPGTKCCACGNDGKTSTCIPSATDCYSTVGANCALAPMPSHQSFKGKCEDLGTSACPSGLQCTDRDGGAHICVLPPPK